MQQIIQSKAFSRTEDLVCKLYIQSVRIFLALFERSLNITEMMFKGDVLHITEMMFKGDVLCFF